MRSEKEELRKQKDEFRRMKSKKSILNSYFKPLTSNPESFRD
jgi:hypothetical protein